MKTLLLLNMIVALLIGLNMHLLTSKVQTSRASPFTPGPGLELRRVVDGVADGG